MPAPTSPKKRALMPSSKLRKALRAAGHHLSAVVQVGKEGVTAAVLRELDQQLAVHELVKVRVGTESPEDRFEAADRLGAAVGAQVAQILGRTVLVYRKDPERPKFEPGPSPRPAPPDSPAKRGGRGGSPRAGARGEGRARRGRSY